MNAPKLRFKEFNDEYKYRNLSDISTLIKDGTHGTHENSENGIPLLSAKDINNNKINIPEDCRKISVDDYNKIYKNYLLKKDDILLTIVGSIGRTALYKNEKVAFQRSVATIRIDDNNNSNYIRQYIESPIIINQLNNMTNSSAQGGVYLSSLSKLNFDIPRKEEQLKVAKFLSLLDKKIELQFKKIEDLKLFKKGLSTTIFNSLRDFEEYKLGKICNITTGKLDANAMIDNGKYRFYTCAKEYSLIDKYAFDTEALLISGNGAYVGYIHYYKGKFNAYQRTYVLDNFSQNIQFIKCYLEENLAKRINSEKKEGNTPYIVLSTLSDMVIKIPSKENQIKISNIINCHNKKIELEENKLLKLQELKKGLMQSMFV